MMWIYGVKQTDEDYLFSFIGKNKLKYTPKSICGGQLQGMLDFVTEVYSYNFDAKPDYAKLKHLLIKQLLNFNSKPTEHFDWSNWRHQSS